MSTGEGYLVLAISAVAILALRARRTLTVQPVRYRSSTMRVILLLVAAALLLPDLVPHPVSLLAFGAGAAVGAGLGAYSSRILVMEPRGDRLFYRTNTWIGIGLILLLVVRLVVDQFVGRPGPVEARHVSIAVPADPVGSALWALFIGYWVVFYLLLLRRV